MSQSAGLASLAANSTTSIQGNQLVFNASPTGPGNVAVFDVTAANVFGNSSLASLSVTANGASAIVINVSGTNVVWNNGMNEIGALLSNSLRETVIWNFYQATSIELDRNFNGALLATAGTPDEFDGHRRQCGGLPRSRKTAKSTFPR